ncbi:hypothetical protein CPU12_11055 [Malaciobacter molluscorum LMG 25693]|uniref:D-alanyl-D-alanine carboxypeptidase, VanY family n=1 Tax=Malaciobacter molluscorum LMG 25693 TaxID=870501 RepID=A0A2G1DFW5_9BACT|nr:D-alanyl-D-alanine carboxypeptidase family protein [Malaciobacter molluscorum]AXX93638.1 D-alanyl-D-alanine carboxypeptidase, VanY family [Malaciobacter molluscorum LMG 25693]PHO17344.1 hypothetical protein CPU12_11055 [Malaciobacter molluscorum LMG 25693]
MNRREFLDKIKVATVLGITYPTISNAYEKVADSIVTSNNNQSSKEDLFIENSEIKDFESVRRKLRQVQRHVGYGNFNIISFDDMLRTAKYSNKIEAFSKAELEFLEKTFYINPSQYGFYGKKISLKMTEAINKKDVVKIPRTGHYLFRGKPEHTYYEMKKDIGDTMVLTSGVRSVVKQMKLYLDKVYRTEGNITKASKSLAPPAYTYHSVGDFDVGKKGFGYNNFTARFALTKEFSQMKKLTYIEMRYTINNKDGVRYEPWHIKVI